MNVCGRRVSYHLRPVGVHGFRLHLSDDFLVDHFESPHFLFRVLAFFPSTPSLLYRSHALLVAHPR